MSTEWFIKKVVKTHEGDDLEVIEFTGIDSSGFLQAIDRYIREFFGIEVKDFKEQVLAFPRKKIESPADLIAPLYQIMEITRFDDSTEQVYFVIPKQPLIA